MPEGRVAVAGDAAPEVAARLAARDVDVMLTDARLPHGPSYRRGGRAASSRDSWPALAAQPLYVDPPEATPAGRRAASAAGRMNGR